MRQVLLIIDVQPCFNPPAWLACGIQTDTCVHAAGFALFDAGLQPTMISYLTVDSSLDRVGAVVAASHGKNSSSNANTNLITYP